MSRRSRVVGRRDGLGSDYGLDAVRADDDVSFDRLAGSEGDEAGRSVLHVASSPRSRSYRIIFVSVSGRGDEASRMELSIDNTHQIHHSRIESDLARLPQTFLGGCQSPKFLLNVGSVVQGPFAPFVLEGVEVSVDQDFGFRGPYTFKDRAKAKIFERYWGKNVEIMCTHSIDRLCKVPSRI